MCLNVVWQGALDIASIVERHLTGLPLPPSERPENRSLLLTPGMSLTR